MPGELVQIDCMTVSRDGQVLKELRAVDPVTRIMVCRVFARATARNAKRFLAAGVKIRPFESKKTLQRKSPWTRHPVWGMVLVYYAGAAMAS